MIKSTDTESSTGPMAGCLKANGKMVDSMVRGSMLTLAARLSSASGRMDKGRSGWNDEELKRSRQASEILDRFVF